MMVAGFGFRKSATLDSLRDAYAKTGHTADALATLAEKADAQAFKALADELALPVRLVSAEALQGENTQTRSDASLTAHKSGSVSEAAALAAAGPQAKLLSARVISDDRLATCALAIAPTCEEAT
jgi:cobalt-precorrin 5A hydrolase